MKLKHIKFFSRLLLVPCLLDASSQAQAAPMQAPPSFAGGMNFVSTGGSTIC